MRAVAAVYAFAGFFAVFALATIVVGVHDASLDVAGFGVTIGSALLVAIGVTLAVAAYRLLQLGRADWPDDKRPPCRFVVLGAFFLTLLIGLYVLFAGLATTGSQWPFVVAVALVLIVVSIVGFWFFGGPEHVSYPKLGAALVVTIVGTSIGVWEFWYQNQYVPSQGGHAVALSIQLHDDGRRGRYDVVRATVDYQDVGGKSVWVIGSVYTLTGSRVVGCSRAPVASSVGKNFFGYGLTDPQRIRYMADAAEQAATVLAAGKFVGDGKRLDSDVSAGRSFVFFVPTGRYQLLRLRAQLFAIPGSVKLSQRTQPRYWSIAGDNEIYGLWHIDDDSWFHDLVYGRERWVVLRYELVDPDHPDRNTLTPAMRVTARFPAPSWTSSQPSDASIQRLFETPQPGDASEPFADTELAIAPVTATNAPC